VPARPIHARAASGSAVAQPTSSPSDPFAPKGVISTALAEARAIVQHMDAGRGGAAAAAASTRPASLTEVSRPYTPRLARRNSPLFQGSPSGSPMPPSSASGGSLYSAFGSDPFPPGPPDSARFGRLPLGSPGAARGSPSPMPAYLAGDDGEDLDDDLALPRPSISRSKSSVRSASRGGLFGDDVGLAELDASTRPDSAASAASSSRPGSTVGNAALRSRSSSTASPGMSMLRRSPASGQMAASGAAAAAVPALAFPASAGSEDDWRMVESLPGEETSRPGTAVPGLARQASAGATSVRVGIAAYSSPSPPVQPRPPSGTASPGTGQSSAAVRARSRSRPSSSKDSAAAEQGVSTPVKTSRPSSSSQPQHGEDSVGAVNVELRSFDSAAAPPPAAARPSSAALFARPLDVPSGTPASTASNAAADSKDASAAATPVLDLAALKALHATWQASSVLDKPDQLRSLLTASYRSLQAARRAEEVSNLISFVLPLPGGDAGAKLQLLAAKLFFEVSREQRNDALLLPLLPLVTERVLARPAERGIKALSYVLGALHNLSVEVGSSSATAATGAAALCSQAMVDALSNLLREETCRRALKLEQEDEHVKLATEVTGVLRNIACAPSAHRLFVTVPANPSPSVTSPTSAFTSSPPPPPLSALDILCHLTTRLSHHAGLLLNLTRIISKLSLHQSCRAIMYAPAAMTMALTPAAMAVNNGSAAAAAAAAVPPASAFLPALVSSLHVHHVKLSLCIRVLYILGNLTMQNDECRRAIVDCTCSAVTVAAAQAAAAREKQGGEAAPAAAAGAEAPTSPAGEDIKGSEVLMSLLARSYQRDSKLRKLLATAAAAASAAQQGSAGAAASSAASVKKHTTMLRENEELLVKLIRLLANVGISPSVGAALVSDKRVAVLFKLLKHKSIDNAEELVLNAVSAVTNLSFYLKHSTASASRPTSAAAGAGTAAAPAAQEEQLLLFTPPRDVMALLLGYLFSSNVELLSETCRSLGNFSRSLSFRSVMSAARADEACTLLLDHSDVGVVYGAAGVVLNIAAHQGAGQSVLFADDAAALHKLADVLARFSGRDLDAPPPDDDEEEEDEDAEPEWGLLSMVLKTFLNLRGPASPRSGQSSTGEQQLVLRREVPMELRLRLLQLLEHILQRCDLERALAAQAAAEEEDADETEAAVERGAVSRAVSEVEALAQQLLPACLPPQQ